MVTDQQVRRLFMFKKKGIPNYQASDKAGISERTAYKYIKASKLPSQLKNEHNWRTRKDPLEKDWAEIREMLQSNPGLEAKTIFEHFQRNYPGRYQEGQLRTFQRRLKYWRAIEGPAKEVYFPQMHYPGKLCASDFTHMNKLGITINRVPFNHLLYHFVLTYSNWETFSICYSESFESLSAGFQNAIWELGGCPENHRSDRMSAAVNQDCNPEKFTKNYQSLLSYYGVKAERTNANSAHENGDVEVSHRHFKRAASQAIMMRGSKDFNSIAEYEQFLRKIAQQLNASRNLRFQEELDVLKTLPVMRLNDHTVMNKVGVNKSSAINVKHNTYSVHSRLKGEYVQVRVYIDNIEIWYAQKMVDRIPRLRGSGKHSINYRHIIDWLVRKPGAFENYRYKTDMFPSSWFRMAYDWLKSNLPLQANSHYVKILYYAAKEGETITENVIRYLLEKGGGLTAIQIKQHIDENTKLPSLTELVINENKLESYDSLLEEVVCHG